MIKRLKTGCQWRELNLKEYFLKEKLSWQWVYYTLSNEQGWLFQANVGCPASSQ